jgi:hypothetical protein
MNAAMRFPDCEFGEALWAAYRRHDKVAVTEKLLGRFAAGLTQSRLLPRTRLAANAGRRARAIRPHPERYTRPFRMFSHAGNN